MDKIPRGTDRKKFDGGGRPFTPWPGLLPLAKTFTLPGGKGEIFFYDSGARPGPEPRKSAAEKPAVLLIHGLGDEADSWRHLMPLLSGAGSRVIAADLPGFGRSVYKRHISIKAHAEALITLMEALNLRQTVLAGSSMGAIAAETVAFKRPDLVKALILMDGCFPMGGRPNAGLLLMGLPFLGKHWYRSYRKNHEAAWKSLYPYYFDIEALGEEDKLFLRRRVIDRVESPAQERGYFASLRSLNALGLTGARAYANGIKSYPGKILLLWGKEDKILPESSCAPILALKPGAVLLTIADAGHLVHQDKPADTAERALDFLRTL
jgi:pimeloyl-ACP methyl ester carboxylesterase